MTAQKNRRQRDRKTITSQRTEPLLIRVRPSVRKKLDQLCVVNNRHRPDIVETLINEAYAEYQIDKTVRINPF